MDIEHIETNETTIEVICGEQPCSIDRNSFFYFVENNGLNAWERNFQDASQPDMHGQQSGYLKEEQYFDLPFGSIKDDIQLFINQKK